MGERERAARVWMANAGNTLTRAVGGLMETDSGDHESLTMAIRFARTSLDSAERALAEPLPADEEP